MIHNYKLLDEPSKTIDAKTTKYFNVLCGDSVRHQRALQSVLLYLSDKSRFYFAIDNPSIEFCDRCQVEYSLRRRDIDIVQLLLYLRKNVTPRDLINHLN